MKFYVENEKTKPCLNVYVQPVFKRDVYENEYKLSVFDLCFTGY